MVTWKNILELIARCLLYTSIVVLADFVLLVSLSGELNRIAPSLSFIMLLEGGIGLTIGGATAVYSPSVAKLSETIFHSKPWDAKRQKEVEAQARMWILSGAILVFAALLLSAI